MHPRPCCSIRDVIILIRLRLLERPLPDPRKYTIHALLSQKHHVLSYPLMALIDSPWPMDTAAHRRLMEPFKSPVKAVFACGLLLFGRDFAHLILFLQVRSQGTSENPHSLPLLPVSTLMCLADAYAACAHAIKQYLPRSLSEAKTCRIWLSHQAFKVAGYPTVSAGAARVASSYSRFIAVPTRALDKPFAFSLLDTNSAICSA